MRPDLALEVHDAATAADCFGDVRSLYADAYREPPYLEGPAEVEQFTGAWDRYLDKPAFRLVLARQRDQAVGMAFGHELPADTDWWDGLITDLSGDLTNESPGRTFALIELAVRSPHRRHGIASAMYRRLINDVHTERITLLVRPEPEASPARDAYTNWGYRRIGRIRYAPDQPTYDAMVLEHTRPDQPPEEAT